jgi:hypothetical protein
MKRFLVIAVAFGSLAPISLRAQEPQPQSPPTLEQAASATQGASNVPQEVQMTILSKSTDSTWDYKININHGSIILKYDDVTAGSGEVEFKNSPDSSLTTIRSGEFSPSFYAQDLSSKNANATLFNIRDEYIAPINIYSGGSCDQGSNMVALILTPSNPPTTSPDFKIADCIAENTVSINGSSLVFSIASADSPFGIHRWTYQNGKFGSDMVEYPPLEDGFSLLVTNNSDLESSVNTRFGNLIISKGPQDEAESISLDGVQQNVPTYNPTGMFPSYIGFAHNVIHDGNNDVVIAELNPDNFESDVFQMITVSHQGIKLSKYFGTKFGWISYKNDQTGLRFNVMDYTEECPQSACDENDKEVRFINRQFIASSGDISLAGNGGEIMPSDNLPAEVQPKTNWYILNNNGNCQVFQLGSPADVISLDKQNGLSDDVVVFQYQNGQAVGVKVGEPQSGGLETVYTFFRDASSCQNYESQQQNQLNQLK